MIKERLRSLSLNNAHEGYDYQDLITSYFILNEILIGNLKSSFSIDRKNTEAGIPDRFDDVVIFNEEDTYRKQVKYSNEQTSIKLIKDFLSGDSHYKLALHKLFESWKYLRESTTEFRLCLAWDEPTDENILNVLEVQPRELCTFSSMSSKVFKINLDKLWEVNPEKFNRWDSLKKYVKENSIDRDEFNEFCNSLVIEVNLPKASLSFDNPSELENILIDQSRKLGIEQYPNDDIYIVDFLQRLVKVVGGYRTKSSVVTVQDVLVDLRLKTDFGKIDQKFEIDKTKNITLDDKYDLFYKKIISNKKTILLGEPGAGKSWFLTNFIQYLESNNKSVIRHYCFTSTEDDLVDKRVSSDVFFGNLVNGILENYPSLTKIKKQAFAANLDELNILLKGVSDSLVIIIDGLDHINRVQISSATLSKEKTKILKFISQIEIPDNVSIVLGSQPIDELDILKDKFNYNSEAIPKWDINLTKELMLKYGVKEKELNNVSVSSLLYRKSEGNPLYLTYILMTFAGSDLITEEDIDSLPKYDFNLKNYYEYLTNQINNNVTAEILSCLDFSVNRKELKEIIPIKHHFESNMKILSPVIYENASRGGIKLYHDSFRRFNLEKLATSADLKSMYRYIADWLNESGFYETDKAYRYLFKYFIRIENFNGIRDFAKNKFLSKSLYYAHSESLIRNNYRNFLYVAEHTQDWSLFVYASELKTAIESTCSEEHLSQFLENFELYFEAVCLIYGAEKAKQLLYYNGEKNHSDLVTAKAFKILQRHGIYPVWSDVSELFENNISVEIFEYYISSLIDDDQKFGYCFNEIISRGLKDYLRVFIEEAYNAKGFDFIKSLFDEIECDELDDVVSQVNDLLEQQNCDNRIQSTESSNVDTRYLNIDFSNCIIDRDNVSELYQFIEIYGKDKLDDLILLEDNIAPSNFMFAWVKFFIQNKITISNIEDAFVEASIVENIRTFAINCHEIKGHSQYHTFVHEYKELIDRSFSKALKHIQSQEAWESIFLLRSSIPYPLLPVIEKYYISQKNIGYVVDAYDQLEEDDSGYYSEHADYSFKKSIYCAMLGDVDRAKKELKKAIHFTTSYTFRKDRNLAEVIDPLVSINKVDSKFSRKYVKKLKHLTDAVMKHTEDGKGIRWLTIEWFEALLTIDYQLASKYLIHEFLQNPNFWKLDYMFVDFLRNSSKVDPAILSFLYMLSPTNARDSYLSGFLEVISRVIGIEDKIAHISMLDLSSRDWNNSNDTLEERTMHSYNEVCKILNLKCGFETKRETKSDHKHYFSGDKLTLSERLDYNLCTLDCFRDKSNEDLLECLLGEDILNVSKLNYLYFFLKEIDNVDITCEMILPLVRKRFPRGEEYFKNLRQLIINLEIPRAERVLLLINNFVYSKDGWLCGLVEKESLRCAVNIDKSLSMKILAQELASYQKNTGYISKSTANLIIAFQHAGLEVDTILEMYKKGFKFIDSRLPSTSDFKWKDLDYLDLKHFSENESAIILLLSKANNMDSVVQQRVLFSLNHLILSDKNLLIKPLKWFFNNLHRFHQLSIASILELILINCSHLDSVIDEIGEDFHKARVIENLYISNTLDEILRVK
ncbi:ATP-binding protein [Vibrio vulnificus]|uniref:ATP-binding protein n=1 Tax=Vibrio vulnificus TaxID=672 RepID=UPI0009C5E3AF|nr:ATP-binding protein [Vibrio vulnificus]EIA1771239.1 ATP-binding protein [Vibrio vulnificus]EIU7596896.1 ATP-binding protein [Vibrio vulnificus]EJE8686949.1 ATP-binding protein [Vibrio vulnificus]ELX4189705.1 ATP-binding protein [Vibrio vulnificus]OQK44163.1 hypothetical protein XM72_c11054 [Vibrio vulnificus]